MSKRSERNKQTQLKTPINRSHNRDSSDERMVALVKFLARRAAENDYEALQDLLASPENIKGGT